MRPARRWVAVVAATVVWLGVGGATIGGVRGADAQPDAPLAPRLRLVDQTPWVAADGRFVARLSLDQPAPGAQIEATLYQPLADRDAFGDSLSGEHGRRFSQGPVTVLGTATEEQAATPGWQVTVNADSTIDLALDVRPGAPFDADRLLLPDAGVYPLVLHLESADGEPLDELALHLVRVPEPDLARVPLGVGLVVPIHSPVALQPDGTTVLSDEELARLDDAVGPLVDHPGVPLTVAPTAETVDALSRLEDPEAVGLLDRLRAALDGRQVVAAPYVDLDLSSWVASGLGRELSDQFVRGTDRLATDLNVQPDDQTWVAGPTVTADSLTRLREQGVDQVVMPEAILGPLEPELFPSALTQSFDVINSNGNRQRAMMADLGLASRIGATGDPVLDANRLIADLALLFFANPDLDQGAVVVLPARSTTRGDPAGPTAADPVFVDTVLDALETAAIVAPETLDTLFDRTSDATVEGPVSDGSPVLVRGFAPAPSLPLGRYPDQLRETQTRLAGYRSLLGGDRPLPYPLEELEMSSAAAGFDGDRRQTYLDAATGRVDASLAEIHVDQQAVTLTGRRGVLPVSVRNDLTEPVTVEVEVESEKLDFPDGSELTAEVPPGISTLEIAIEARASGAFPVDVRVGSLDGVLTVSDARITVRSSAVSGLGIVLSVLAALFLLIWWARHFRKGRRANRLVSTRHPAAQQDARRAQDQFLEGISDGPPPPRPM
jgi:hypothetical protein